MCVCDCKYFNSIVAALVKKVQWILRKHMATLHEFPVFKFQDYIFSPVHSREARAFFCSEQDFCNQMHVIIYGANHLMSPFFSSDFKCSGLLQPLPRRFFPKKVAINEKQYGRGKTINTQHCSVANRSECSILHCLRADKAAYFNSKLFLHVYVCAVYIEMYIIT